LGLKGILPVLANTLTVRSDGFRVLHAYFATGWIGVAIIFGRLFRPDLSKSEQQHNDRIAPYCRICHPLKYGTSDHFQRVLERPLNL
jgi:hypothetical protein